MNSVPVSTYKSSSVILELIYRMKVREVMSRKLVTAPENATLREIQNIMKEKKITGVPIVKGSHLLGLVSIGHIIEALDRGYIEEPASKHMTTELIVLEDDMPVSFAIQHFDKFKFHRFPVLNKDKELVGMITNGDITTRLLVEIEKEVDALERETSKLVPKEPLLPKHVESYSIKRRDFEKAGFASTQIKKQLKKAGLDSATIRRAAIASYELEMNIVVHSYGGELIAELGNDEVAFTARDYGPGIEDVNLALEKGYTTADEWTRSLGFGAGMGLPNVQNVSDEFSITSSPSGTVAVSKIWLKKQGVNL